METDSSARPHYEVDDRFFEDWVAFGMAELEVYLAVHARFADWCERRQQR